MAILETLGNGSCSEPPNVIWHQDRTFQEAIAWGVGTDPAT